MTGASHDAPYEVGFAPAAAKELGKLRADDAARLRRPILGLAFEPRPAGVRGVAGTRYLRLRVDDLRMIYLVMDDQRLVVITRIAKRSERTYRPLEGRRTVDREFRLRASGERPGGSIDDTPDEELLAGFGE